MTVTSDPGVELGFEQSLDGYPGRPATMPIGAVFHALLLGALFVSFYLPHVFSARRPQMLLVRQAMFALYFLVIFACSRLKPALGHTRGIAPFLLLAALMGLSLTLTTFTVAMIPRMIDYVGGLTFFLAMMAYSLLLPRVLGEKADGIILVAVLSVFLLLVVFLTSGLRLYQRGEGGNMIGNIAGLGATLCAAIWLRKVNSRPARLLGMIGVGAFCIVQILSGSRTAMAAFAATFMLLILLGSRARRKILWILAIAVLVLVVSLTGAREWVVKYVIYKGGNIGWEGQEALRTLHGRQDLWRSLLGASKGHVLLGRGTAWVRFATGGTTAHSSYLHVYFEYGLVGAIPFVLMCAWAGIAAVKNLHRRRNLGGAGIAPAMVLFFLVVSVAETYFNQLPGVLMAVFALGTGLCMRDNAGLEGAVPWQPETSDAEHHTGSAFARAEIPRWSPGGPQ